MPNTHSQNSSIRGFLVYHLPAITAAAAIILLSSIPNLNVPKLSFLPFDKLLHFGEYAIFAFLIFRSFSHLSSSLTRHRAFLISILFLSVFAFLDELHQSFVPGRDSDVYDLVGDVLGAICVLTYLWVRLKRAEKVKRDSLK